MLVVLVALNLFHDVSIKEMFAMRSISLYLFIPLKMTDLFHIFEFPFRLNAVKIMRNVNRRHL